MIRVDTAFHLNHARCVVLPVSTPAFGPHLQALRPDGRVDVDTRGRERLVDSANRSLQRLVCLARSGCLALDAKLDPDSIRLDEGRRTTVHLDGVGSGRLTE